MCAPGIVKSRLAQSVDGFVGQKELKLHSVSSRKPAEILGRGVTPSAFYQGDNFASDGRDSFLEKLILPRQQALGC